MSYVLAAAACRTVASASFDEVQGILDKSAAIGAYARQAGNLDLEADAVEIRMRATRRRIDSASSASCLVRSVSPAIGSSNSVDRPRASSLGPRRRQAQGRLQGPPAFHDVAKVTTLKAEGLGATEIRQASQGRVGVCLSPAGVVSAHRAYFGFHSLAIRCAVAI